MTTDVPAMKQRLQLIFKIFFLLAMPFLGTSQDLDTLSTVSQNSDTVAITTVGSLIQGDTVLLDSTIRNEIFLIVDYGKLAMAFSSFESKYEGGLGISLKKGATFIIEAGFAEVVPRNAYPNTDYRATGTYIRPGISLRMTNTPKNSLSLGLKYGISSFEDQLSLQLSPSGDPKLFDDFELIKPKRKDLTANWIELSLMTERHFNQIFSLGIHVRFKYLIRHSTFSPVDIFTIPGYGRAVDKTTPAVNLYLKLRLP